MNDESRSAGLTGEDSSELALPIIDVTPERAEHIRRRAHAILRAEREAPPVASFAYRYERSIEPALLIGLGVCQAIWAARGTWLLFQ